jgi:hypothetical protein
LVPLFLPLPLLLIGIVLLNLPSAARFVQVIGAVSILASLCLSAFRVLKLLTGVPNRSDSGPYVLVPTTVTWRQLGYPSHPSRNWAAVHVYVHGDVLDLIGSVPGDGGVSASVLRSRLLAVRARRVQVDGEPWWGIAIQRLDKPDDLEFGIRDDQRDVAAAEQRAIEVAAQLTRAMRLDEVRDKPSVP